MFILMHVFFDKTIVLTIAGECAAECKTSWRPVGMVDNILPSNQPFSNERFRKLAKGRKRKPSSKAHVLPSPVFDPGGGAYTRTYADGFGDGFE
jgi:hypothetical protein